MARYNEHYDATMDATPSPTLGCYIRKVEYDARTGVGVIHMPDGHCTDMRGAIGIMKSIDPFVCEIKTVNDYGEDTTYTKHGDRWLASSPDGKISWWSDDKSFHALSAK